MRIQEWLNFFKEYRDIKIFHFNHLKLLAQMSSHSLRVSLTRLEKRSVVRRISRGFYANPFNLPSLKEISGRIYQPSYVSLETVLSEEGIITQIFLVLTCVTLLYQGSLKQVWDNFLSSDKERIFWVIEMSMDTLLQKKGFSGLDLPTQKKV